MWKPSTHPGNLLILFGILTLSSVGCSGDSSESAANPAASPVASPVASPAASPVASPAASPAASPSASTVASPSASPAANPSAKLTPVLKPKLALASKVAPSPTGSPSANPEAYNRAIDIAMGASTISKSAVSRDDWKLVANSWQQAIDFLKQVPPSSPQHAIAKTKLSQYQRFLADAKQKSAPLPKKNTVGDVNPAFFSIPIKGRRNGTPIIEVSFNNQRKFDMLFDTGATITLIPESIALSLQLKPQGSTIVTVADGAAIVVPKTTLKSMEIDGRVKRNMVVVVAPPAMEEGLLGQDFYEGYDIAIKQNIIEFRRYGQ